MPTYEYQCLSCKHEFEILQSITAKPKTKCPECGKKLKKLISGPAGFIFKGAGFYATDYKKTAGSSIASAVNACPKAAALSKAGQSMAKDGCAGCPGR